MTFRKATNSSVGGVGGEMAENKQQPDTIYSLSSKADNYFPYAKKTWLTGGKKRLFGHILCERRPEANRGSFIHGQLDEG